MGSDILHIENSAPDRTPSFIFDHTVELFSHYSVRESFHSDVERTLAQKWEWANTV